MSERTAYRPGVPCWVGLSSHDITASVRFYRDVLGWDAAFDARPGAAGEGRFTLNGRVVAGVGHAAGDLPAGWHTHIAVEDAWKTAERVAAAGGHVVREPYAVMDEGHAAGFQDPAGAFFMIWQPGRRAGAELVNEPGTFTWNELATRDTATARSFYPAVFGWGAEEDDMGGMEYTVWQVEGEPVGGMMAMGPQFPSDVPPHWLTYFAVTDCEATVASVERLGGTVFVPPMDLPVGRFAVMADPQDAAFAVIQPSEG
ncbi:VOC family protein [Streptosporangium sp. KLBMP 9127]|nr:VOC family protein [Streptosporangium sp. KLBMP 9127]